jgi:two-component system, OmpR family, osmolarity sensor histidine kinase EnvZ
LRRLIPSNGLIGRLIAILLVTLVIEFATSTILYERASRLRIREDQAYRVAEHLTFARQLVGRRPVADRHALTDQLSDDRIQIGWQPMVDGKPTIAPELVEMRRQMIEWEPVLGRARLQLFLASPGRAARVVGALALPDGTWLTFRATSLVDGGRFRLNRIALALVPAIALILIGSLLVRHTLLPLRILSAAADRIGHDESVPLLRETGTGDVRRLFRAFNAMQDRIRRLIAGRTEALAGVGHDLRTPLARLKLRTDEIADPELRAAVGTDITEMQEMIESLLAYFGGEDDPEAPVVIDIAVAAATLVDAAIDRGADAAYDGPDHLEAAVRPLGLRRALGNLIDNALHYGGQARVSLLDERGWIVLRVDDDGPGIPADEIDRALAAFTRLDPSRGRNTRGLGLGLTIVARSVARENGKLSLVNRPEGGLRAEIALPRG